MTQGHYVRTAEIKEKYRQAKLGSKHPLWKSDDVSYVQLHKWVRSRIPLPIICPKCCNPNKLQLANITGKYTRDLDNWQYMCRRCHFHFDKQPRNPTNGKFEVID